MKKITMFLLIALFLVVSQQARAVTTHTFTSGDTLWELAAKHYGDPTLYPVFMAVNNIDNPRTIPNGKVIIIPDKKDLENIAQETDPDKKQELINQVPGGQNSFVPPTPAGNGNDNTSADAVSRGGEKVNPNDTSFSNILQGPKVSPDKLIKLESSP
jgi:LysM repeat protein